MKTFICLILCVSFQFFGLQNVNGAAAETAAGAIRVVRIADTINPVVADFIVSELKEANARSERAFLLEIDTPGGLDTSMRSIIRAILGSRIPVIVYVYPAGARAASAGALITLAADFAVMAPGTNIGAAHPVNIGFGGAEKGSTMMEKVVNDAVAYARSIAEQRGRNANWAEKIVRKSTSTPAREALKLRVIDLIAADEQALLSGLDGRSYLRDGKKLVLHSAGAHLERVEMGVRQQILTAISNPTVAYMLLMLGILGIFFEIAQPGVILPGTLGAIAILLAFFAFQTLPVNYVGVLLILLAFVLFILEVKVVSYGMLTVGGIISMALGSIMLFESSDPYLRLSWTVIAATVGVTSGFFALALYFMIRTHRTPFVSGLEGMTGERGRAVSDVHNNGRVFVHGEYWDACSHEPIAEGETVEVVRVEKGVLRLEVRRVGPTRIQNFSEEDIQ
jgi:membrane-bound serine protease (ClpP class)